DVDQNRGRALASWHQDPLQEMLQRRARVAPASMEKECVFLIIEVDSNPQFIILKASFDRSVKAHFLNELAYLARNFRRIRACRDIARPARGRRLWKRGLRGRRRRWSRWPRGLRDARGRGRFTS